MPGCILLSHSGTVIARLMPAVEFLQQHLVKIGIPFIERHAVLNGRTLRGIAGGGHLERGSAHGWQMIEGFRIRLGHQGCFHAHHAVFDCVLAMVVRIFA